MKAFASEIYAAVRSGRLSEPFTAAMVMQARPGWAERTYHVFLSKHAEGNGKNTVLFVRVARAPTDSRIQTKTRPGVRLGGSRTVMVLPGLAPSSHQDVLAMP